LLCQSSKVLGNGRIENLYDVVVVDSQRFERSRSQEVAKAVAHFNGLLSAENRPYLLIGVGRWGSKRSLARNSRRVGRNLRSTRDRRGWVPRFSRHPFAGQPFLQNLTAFQIGYFTVNPDAGEGSIDWRWLSEQSSLEEDECVRHLHFERPIRVVMNSRISKGIILKPEPI